MTGTARPSRGVAAFSSVPAPPSPAAWLPATMGMYGIIAACVVLVGWITNTPALTDWDGNGISMLPNSALCLLCSGLAIVLLALGHRRTPVVLGAIVALFGGATLFEHITGTPSGIDRVLLLRSWGQGATVVPGRMGPPSSFAWTLIGLTVVLCRATQRFRLLAATTGIVVSAMTLFSLVGYLYHAAPLYSIPRLTAIAPETATGIFAVGIGLIALVPERGLAAQLARPDAGGVIARRLILPVFLLPAVIGWLRLAGEHAGLFDARFGTAARTVTETILLVALVWWIARGLSRTAQARERDQRALRDQFEAAQTLQRISTQLVRADDVRALYEQILDAAVSLMHADFGTLQMVDAERGELRLLSARGFDDDAVRACEWVARTSPTACGQAFRDETRLIVADVERSGFPADGPVREMWTRLGIRSLQATPLVSRGREVMGMIATHWRAPHVPSESELRLLDILGRQAADVVERSRDVASLRTSERTQRLLAEISVLAAEASIAGETPGEGLSTSIFESVARELNVSRCGLTRADLATGCLVVEHDAHLGLASLKGAYPIEQYAAHMAEDSRAGRTTAISDLATDPRTAAVYEARYAPIQVRSHVNVPLHREGQWVGAFWVASEEPRAWTRGEIDLVQTLAQGVWLILEESRIATALRESEARLATEADALIFLNELSARLWQMPTLQQGLDQMVSATLLLLRADKGNIQLLEPEGRVLRIAAQYGFDDAFLEAFRAVTADDASACGRALRRGEPIAIADIEADADYAPLRPVARAAGYRAVHSTPLVGRDGAPVGIVSAHFASVHAPSEQELRGLDLYLRHAVAFIERKRAEDALREAERRKDEFLAILAHELRNPLAPVRNAAHYLRLRELPEAELRRPVEMIERQVTHMARLIEDLLDVSRISRGMLELRLERVATADVLEAAVDACQDEVRARGHALEVTGPGRPVELLADRARLIQALSNLLSNAAKYTPTGGRIALVARATDDTLELRVKDNGIGIPPGKLREIFELFAQVDRSLERQGGLGIGLTLTRQLIELHGGTIEAKSDGVGYGSEFVLRLPIAAATAPRAHATAPAEAATAERLRILVADDNPDAVESLALLLSLAGHEVHTAFDGEQAAALAAEAKPDVALLDIGMPRLNGYDAARRIRARPETRRTFLVAVTGWGQEDDRRRATEAGFDAHLVKPVSPEALNQLLARPAASLHDGQPAPH